MVHARAPLDPQVLPRDEAGFLEQVHAAAGCRGGSGRGSRMPCA